MRQVKEGHCALTLTMPAKGKLWPLLWTFAGGTIEKFDMASDASTSYWQRTENGWPDKATMRAWGKIVVEEMERRGLKKLLIFVDNAEIHTDIELRDLFRRHKVTLVGLIASGTGFQQPCDKFFAILKVKIPSIARRWQRIHSYKTIAGITSKAVDEIQAAADSKGLSIGTKSFKICGIFPLVEGVFTDADFGPSDARLGLSKASPEVAAARALGHAQSAEVVSRALALHLPDAREGLADSAAKAKEAREKAVGKSKGSFEERSVYTSELFHAKRVSMADAKATEEARLDAVRAKRLENKAKKVEERAAIEERKAARAALKEAKEAAAAARKAAPASAASSGKKRARSEVEADPESDVVSGEATKKRRRPAKKPDENMYKKIYVPKK